MAPASLERRALPAVAAALLMFSLPIPAHALRLVNYNVMLYPNVNVTGRNPYFRQVFAPLGADLVVVQEMGSQAGVDSIRINVLNANEPGQWSSAPFTNGNDYDNAFFYKPSKVEFLGQRSFYVSSDLLRLVNEYRVKPVGYGSASAEIRIYSVHLKAGTSDEAQRLREATGLRDTLNGLPPGTHAIVTGDFNMYDGTEPALARFLENMADNDGRLYDPLNLTGGWQDNAALAIYHTQCPSTTAYRPSGSYSGGGVDDRFDLFLPTFNMRDGDGLDLLTPTYVVVGNDGQHLNKSVTDAPIAPADTAYARALWWASDHLPVRVDLQLPARVDAPLAPLAFGSVIVGAAASQNLTVSNAAAEPADTLEYSYSAPAGFLAPPGTLTRLAAQSAADAIALDTTTPAIRSGTLALASNDLDAPLLSIPVSGTVLDHASPSLDSLVAVTETTLDLGDAAGPFAPAEFRVHDRVWNALRARLAVNAAAITGPSAARFTLVGGGLPALLGAVGRTWSVAFDANGAPADSTYRADLTLATADEALPGGTPAASLVLHLRARVTGGSVGVPGDGLPAVTMLHAPVPNPFRDGGTVRLDLATPSPVSLEVFDLSGRRVSTLERGSLPAGVHAYRWNARHDDGRTVGAGLYFIRLSGAGLAPATVRAVVVH